MILVHSNNFFYSIKWGLKNLWSHCVTSHHSLIRFAHKARNISLTFFLIAASTKYLSSQFTISTLFELMHLIRIINPDLKTNSKSGSRSTNNFWIRIWRQHPNPDQTLNSKSGFDNKFQIWIWKRISSPDLDLTTNFKSGPENEFQVWIWKQFLNSNLDQHQHPNPDLTTNFKSGSENKFHVRIWYQIPDLDLKMFLNPNLDPTMNSQFSFFRMFLTVQNEFYFLLCAVYCQNNLIAKLVWANR